MKSLFTFLGIFLVSCSNAHSDSRNEQWAITSGHMFFVAKQLADVDGMVLKEAELLQKNIKNLTPTSYMTAETCNKKDAKADLQAFDPYFKKLFFESTLFEIALSDGDISKKEIQFLKTWAPIFEVPFAGKKSFTEIIGKQKKEEELKSKRAAIPQSLKLIKTAQIAYDQDWDVYIHAAPYPSPEKKRPTKWVVEESGGFKSIDFKPSNSDAVYGTYWVDVGPTNFTATGIIDADGDGVYATYISTKSVNPNSPITPSDVY